MTPDQALDLVDLLSAANVLNRMEDRTPDVWAAALCDLDAHDCMQAAANLIRTQQWVKICDIRQAVHELRAERLTGANIVYDGIPGETGAQSIARRRAQIDAAATGQLPPANIGRIRAIEAAPRPDSTRLDNIGDEVCRVPGARDGAVNVLAVPCPICHARPRRTCTSTIDPSKHRADVHPARLEDARRIASGQPPVDPQEAERELERRQAAARAYLDQLSDKDRAQLAAFQRQLRDSEAS